jgi:hypothetical protein
LTDNAGGSGDPEPVRSDVLDESVSREAARTLPYRYLRRSWVIDDDATGRVRHKKGFKITTCEEIAADVPDATVISDYQETLPR